MLEGFHNRYANALYVDGSSDGWAVSRLAVLLTERRVLFQALFNADGAVLDDKEQVHNDCMKKKAALFVLLRGGPEANTNDVSVESFMEVITNFQKRPKRTVLVFDLASMPDGARAVYNGFYRHAKSLYPELQIFESLEAVVDFLATKFGQSAAA
jgi:prepilin-type processing-associated H-X9-DG protein